MPIIYKPVSNVCVDMDITIATTDWSSSAPYTYDWMNQVISGDCSVEVNYLAGALNYKDVYISYEKITGGIEFTAPVKPTVDIPVRIHIVNTLASDVLDLSGDMISTSAVNGAVNVDEALGVLNDRYITQKITGTYSANANSQGQVNFNVPTGYTIVSVMPVATGSQKCFIRFVTDGVIGIYNLSNSDLTNLNLTCIGLFKKIEE